MKWLKRALGAAGLEGAGREKAEQLVTQGVVHAREGRLNDALACYRDAQDADQELAVAHLNEGLALLDILKRDLASIDEQQRKDTLTQVAQTLGRALRLDGKSVVGWRALAHVEERRASFARAEDAWKNVRDLVANDPSQLLARQEADRALAAIAEDARVDRARRRAIAAQKVDVEEGERRVALEELLALLKPGATQKPVERGLALAGALARRNHDARARELLTQAVAEDAGDLDALRDLAGVCLEAQDLPSALSYSLKAYVADPTDAALVCNVGVCHLGLGDVERAAEFIDIAQKLEPKDPIVVRAAAALKAARSDNAAS